MFAIVDCNNFYVSCERLFRPDLIRSPVVVLSNNDGCVIARSEEAKALGIAMGEPFFKVKSLVKQHKVTIFSSNYMLYGDLSQRVMSAIESSWSEVEIYSIDEAFLNLNAMPESAQVEFLEGLQRKILKNVGIPCSIGFGKTKTLAKVANLIAKRLVKIPVFTLVDLKPWLSRVPVSDIWGVGRCWGLKLVAQGIHNAWELAQCDPHHIRKQFNIMLMRTVMELNGIPCCGLEPEGPSHSIMSSRSFGTMQTEYESLSQAISSHAARVCEKARSQESVAHSVQVFVRSNRHRQDLKQYNNSIICSLIHPSNDTRIITHTALEGLKRLFKSGVHYKKVGVGLVDLIPSSMQQDDLFLTIDPEVRMKSNRLMSIIDQVNNRYGRRTIRLASEGYSQKWAMESSMRSPCYTTRWEDLIKVK